MRYITFLKSLWFKNDQPSDLELQEKVRLSKNIPKNQKYFHTSKFEGWLFLNQWKFGDVIYLIWKVWSVGKWSQKLKGVAFSLTQNPTDNNFLAMTKNVNQLSVKTFNFPEFQSHKIRSKCRWIKVPLWQNVHILMGCSCHIGGTLIQLHFKVLPYWK